MCHGIFLDSSTNAVPEMFRMLIIMNYFRNGLDADVKHRENVVMMTMPTVNIDILLT